MSIRPEIMKFAELMELSLRNHDDARGKTGWKNETVTFLFTRFLEEVDETEIAVLRWHNEPKNSLTRGELAEGLVDVGCLAMMVIDNLGELSDE